MLETTFSPFPELQTERLILRRLLRSDAPAILRLRGNEVVMKYIDRDRALTTEDAFVFIDRIQASLDTDTGITWAMAFKSAPDELIGTIGFWRMIREHHRAELGYMLDPAEWRKGIMKEAINEVVAKGFSLLQLHSVEARIDPNNTGSALVLQSTGFVKEAHLKEAFYYNGVFKDTVIYSKLNS
ncbi:MAG: GNAT family N-acetyltransferase [Bacteroidota bacterium]|nr:GNAT family N-acetyltransferase [Ferruginibacter sp.]